MAAMNAVAAHPARQAAEALCRDESRRIFVWLVRLLGNLDHANEALHESFRAALEQWPRDGVPANPRAWLVSAGRFRIIDRQRLIFTCCHPALALVCTEPRQRFRGQRLAGLSCRSGGSPFVEDGASAPSPIH